VTVVSEGKQIDVSVTKVVPVDATGAGDQFAAGFLFGMATGRDLETCAKIGCVCAGEVISHIGPRPEANMLHMLKAEGLI
jgi:sugar/nucleoside kinase (ribokinase family)